MALGACWGTLAEAEAVVVKLAVRLASSGK